GNRNLNDVLADIDKWKTIYPMVNALFIDEIPYDANVSELNYIISYARAKGFRYIIGNSGTPIPENKILQLKFDNLVVHESNSYQVNTTFEGNWEDSYREQSKTKFSGIIYGVSKGIDYHFFYNFQKYFSYVYVCNNYNTLPSYFEELLGYIDALSTFKPNIISNPLPPKTYWLLNITSNTYLTNLTLVSSRFYLMPFITETKLKLNNLAIYVNTASSGTCFTGIYSSVNNRPSTLLTNVLFDVGTTQEKIQPVNIELAPNTVYFFGLVSTSNPTIIGIQPSYSPYILGTTGFNLATTYGLNATVTNQGGEFLPRKIEQISESLYYFYYSNTTVTSSIGTYINTLPAIFVK
ncbi:MAG: spherulation-specific family 4 protein, partial [Candidatus Aenigmatarchaeota archaeon]